MKKAIFSFLMTALTFLVCAGLGELLVRIFDPQACFSPRLQFSDEYGAVLPANITIDNFLPGRYDYHYTINQYGYRGPAVPLTPQHRKRNIVILGDSFGFGTGVNDDEVFSAVIKKKLGDDYEVINLSVGGYGLTQEIRRYVEFGRLYAPEVVILQFCANDPADNIVNRVAEVQGDTFAFMKTRNSAAWVKKYLSSSPLQQSQLYNYIRDRGYNLLAGRSVLDARITATDGARVERNDTTTYEETFYNRLLEIFARNLRGSRVRFLMIAVNGQLSRFPGIQRKVAELNEQDLLEYVEVIPWFEKGVDYSSPEGHSWGAKAHAVLGHHLAEIILTGRRASSTH